MNAKITKKNKKMFVVFLENIYDLRKIKMPI
jgi:hypothetical protein